MYSINDDLVLRLSARVKTPVRKNMGYEPPFSINRHKRKDFQLVA